MDEEKKPKKPLPVELCDGVYEEIYDLEHEELSSGCYRRMPTNSDE